MEAITSRVKMMGAPQHLGNNKGESNDKEKSNGILVDQVITVSLISKS